MWPWKSSDIETNDTTVRFRDLLASMIGKSHKNARDIYEIFGYDRTRSFDTYWEYYRLNDYANRIVAGLPKSCWRDGVVIKDSNKKEVLEQELITLFRSKMFRKLENADILNRIGSHSVLYVGVPDGEVDPKTPLGTSSAKRLNEVFFTPFAENGIIVSEYDTDILSPRFDLPTLYTLQTVPEVRDASGVIEQARSIVVHWSRIVHMAEGSLGNGVIGESALAPVLNRVKDLDKTIGGSSEAYFRNARGKIAFKSDSNFTGFKDDLAKAAFDKQAAAFTQNWQDWIALSGIEAKSIDTRMYDPINTVKIALQAISAQTGIPIRILTGEGAGQMTGNEDKASYDTLVNDRQNLVCEEWVLRVFEILSNANMLDFKDDYTIEWPEVAALNEKDRAEVDSKKATAFKAVAEALGEVSLDGLVDSAEVFKEVLGIDLKIDTDESSHEDGDLDGDGIE